MIVTSNKCELSLAQPLKKAQSQRILCCKESMMGNGCSVQTTVNPARCLSIKVWVCDLTMLPFLEVDYLLSGGLIIVALPRLLYFSHFGVQCRPFWWQELAWGQSTEVSHSSPTEAQDETRAHDETPLTAILVSLFQGLTHQGNQRQSTKTDLLLFPDAKETRPTARPAPERHSIINGKTPLLGSWTDVNRAMLARAETTVGSPRVSHPEFNLSLGFALLQSVREG